MSESSRDNPIHRFNGARPSAPALPQEAAALPELVPADSIGELILRLIAEPGALLRQTPQRVVDVVVGMVPYLESPLPGRDHPLSADEVRKIIRPLQNRVIERGDEPAVQRDLNAVRQGLRALPWDDPRLDQLPHSHPLWVYRDALQTFGAIRDAQRCMRDPGEVRERGDQMAATLREAVHWIGHAGLTGADFERFFNELARRYWTSDVPRASWFDWAPMGFASAGQMMAARRGGLGDESFDLRAVDDRMLRVGLASASLQGRIGETVVAANRAVQLGGIPQLLERAPLAPVPDDLEMTLFAWTLAGIREPKRYVKPAKELVGRVVDLHDSVGPGERKPIVAALESVLHLLRSLEIAGVIAQPHPLTDLAKVVATAHDLRSSTTPLETALLCLSRHWVSARLAGSVAGPVIDESITLVVEGHRPLGSLQKVINEIAGRRVPGLNDLLDFVAAFDAVLMRMGDERSPARRQLVDAVHRQERAGNHGAEIGSAERRVATLLASMRDCRRDFVTRALDDVRVHPGAARTCGRGELDALLGHAVAEAADRHDGTHVRAVVDALVKLHLSGRAPEGWGGLLAEALRRTAYLVEAHNVPVSSMFVSPPGGRAVGTRPTAHNVPVSSMFVPPLQPGLPADQGLRLRILRPGSYPEQLEYLCETINALDALGGPHRLLPQAPATTYPGMLPPRPGPLVGLALAAIIDPRRQGALRQMLRSAVSGFDAAAAQREVSGANPGAWWQSLDVALRTLRAAALVGLLDQAGQHAVVAGERARLEQATAELADAVALRAADTDSHELAARLLDHPDLVVQVRPDRLADALAAARMIPPLSGAHDELLVALIRATWGVDRGGDGWRTWGDAVIGHLGAMLAGGPSARRLELVATRDAIMLMRFDIEPMQRRDEAPEPPLVEADPGTLRHLAEVHISTSAAPPPELAESIACGLALILAHRDPRHAYPAAKAINLLMQTGRTALAAAAADNPQPLSRLVRGFGLLRLLRLSGAIVGEFPATLVEMCESVVAVAASLSQTRRIVLPAQVQRVIGDGGGLGPPSI